MTNADDTAHERYAVDHLLRSDGIVTGIPVFFAFSRLIRQNRAINLNRLRLKDEIILRKTHVDVLFP